MESIMTREELLSKNNHSLKMSDLREFVSKNWEIKDDAPVIVERVEDAYFTGREFNGEMIQGWDVLKVEGWHHNDAVSWNEKMEKEIQLREQGKSNYPKLKNPSDLITAQEELESYKEQFYRPHCISTDKEIVYIYSHY